MPGAYAHIILANTLANQRDLGEMSFPKELIVEILKNKMYCELGAISPDMPYLAIESNKSAQWADAMHKYCVGDRLRAGLKSVVKCSETVRPKRLCWFLGFVEHVVFDMVMHPIVNKRVGGAYSEETSSEHRKCEMHQDVFISNRYIGLENLISGKIICSGLRQLHEESDNGKIDPSIKEVWETMLLQSTPSQLMSVPYDIDHWFAMFTMILGAIERASSLISFSRHVGVDILYPDYSSLDSSYIVNLSTPQGDRRNYSNIFEYGKDKVKECWAKVAYAINNKDDNCFNGIGEWNLDTGESPNKLFHFWS
jgi:hypothetical protein